MQPGHGCGRYYPGGEQRDAARDGYTLSPILPSLIGMGAIVTNGARIGRGSVVGAGAVITEGKQFGENSLIIGAPARVIRTLDPDQAEKMGRAAQSYMRNGPRFKKGLKKIG
jgi:carbonic anhydrase/acetyltransferase-like protein (isoleucine patch superfamily)